MKVTDPFKKLLAVLAAGGIYASGAVYAANLDTNLVVNPGFENVNTAITGAYNSPKILDWLSPVGGNAFAYAHVGQGGQGTDYANGRPLAGGGQYYFSADLATGLPTASGATAPGHVYQDIDVSQGASGSLIATGNAAYKISGFFSGYLAQPDKGVFHVNFLNSGGTSLGTAQVSNTDPSTWNQYFAGGLVPVGTATARVSVYGAPGFSGGPSAYIDNVDFQVSTQLIQTALAITVNRDTGEITLNNQTGATVPIKSYVITSAYEALAPANWKSITDNYDAGNAGPNQIDAVHNWSKLTNAASRDNLSEADLESGVGGSIAFTKSIPIGNANAWIRTPTEDLVFQYISGTQIKTGIVQYIGHGSVPFVAGDLNTDGVINTTDWNILRGNQLKNLSASSLAEAYRLGDLTGDKLNDHADFVLFKAAYDLANGAGAFAAMLSAVPEPSTSCLVLAAGTLFLPALRRRSNS